MDAWLKASLPGCEREIKRENSSAQKFGLVRQMHVPCFM